jgi:hypothetical protein
MKLVDHKDVYISSVFKTLHNFSSECCRSETSQVFYNFLTFLFL